MGNFFLLRSSPIPRPRLPRLDFDAPGPDSGAPVRNSEVLVPDSDDPGPDSEALGQDSETQAKF